MNLPTLARLTIASVLLLTLAFGALFSRKITALTQNEIDFRQTGNQLRINLASSSLAQGVTWRYQPRADQQCHAGLTEGSWINPGHFLTLSSQGALLHLETIQPTFYCFHLKTADNRELWIGYLTKSLDDSPPTISVVRKSNDTLSISSADRDIKSTSWRWEKFNVPVNCNNNSISRPFSVSQQSSKNHYQLQLTEDDNYSYFCAKAEDIHGNSRASGIAVNGVDTTPPKIDASLTGRVLSARADEIVSSWSYISSPNTLQCDDTTFQNNRSVISGQQVTLTASNQNDYFCFRAIDSANNQGFAPFVVTNVDFSSPIVTLQQEATKLVASSNQIIANWRYLKADSVSACANQPSDQSGHDFTARATIDLSLSDHQRFVCVRAMNKTNIAGYAWIQIDSQPPDLQITTDSNFIIHAKSNETSDDLQWSYIKSKTEPACNDNSLFQTTNINYHLGNSSQLFERDNNWWICFEVKDSVGNASYAKQLISGVTLLSPADSPPSADSKLDIIILSILLFLSVGGFITYYLLQARNKNRQSNLSETRIYKPADQRQMTDLTIDYLQEEEQREEKQ